MSQRVYSLLDYLLDDFGYAHKPGSTKGRHRSARYDLPLLKAGIKDLMLELMDGVTDEPNWYGELRQKVEEL